MNPSDCVDYGKDMRNDYLHNLLELCFVNAAAPIFVIHFKSPFQFVLQLSSQH